MIKEDIVLRIFVYFIILTLHIAATILSILNIKYLDPLALGGVINYLSHQIPAIEFWSLAYFLLTVYNSLFILKDVFPKTPLYKILIITVVQAICAFGVNVGLYFIYTNITDLYYGFDIDNDIGYSLAFILIVIMIKKWTLKTTMISFEKAGYRE